MPRLDAAHVEQSDYVAELLLQAVFECYAGQVIYIPKRGIESKKQLGERNRTIKALYDSGVSVADIARRYRLSAPHVWTLVGRVRGG